MLFGENFHAVTLGWGVDRFDDGTIVYQHSMIAAFSAFSTSSPSLAVVVLYNNVDWDDHIGHTLLLTLSRNA